MIVSIDVDTFSYQLTNEIGHPDERLSNAALEKLRVELQKEANQYIYNGIAIQTPQELEKATLLVEARLNVTPDQMVYGVLKSLQRYLGAMGLTDKANAIEVIKDLLEAGKGKEFE